MKKEKHIETHFFLGDVMEAEKRHAGRNQHHLKPVCRGGNGHAVNKLLLHVDRHEHWHKVFGTRTLEEVIFLLQRVRRAKQSQEYNKEEVEKPSPKKNGHLDWGRPPNEKYHRGKRPPSSRRLKNQRRRARRKKRLRREEKKRRALL